MKVKKKEYLQGQHCVVKMSQQIPPSIRCFSLVSDLRQQRHKGKNKQLRQAKHVDLLKKHFKKIIQKSIKNQVHRNGIHVNI